MPQIDAAPVQARPFVKWAGSKRWLTERILDLVPSRFGDYHEPFVGSGSVFFALYFPGRHHYLSDSIEPLINCYRQIALAPDAVIAMADSWAGDRDSYYELRARTDLDDVGRAARFIYLNRLCFNGLYRENSSGQFNVPYGRPNSMRIVHDAPSLRRVANILSDNVTIVNQDFEESLQNVKHNDLVYLDPPYISGHKANGFVDYNAKVFSWDDQHRLREYVDALAERGAHFILSNADHPSIRDLYGGYEQTGVARFSSMSARAGSRGPTDELLVTNVSRGTV